MMKLMIKKFTLIELLIVIALIAILMTFLLPSISAARNKARMAVCMSNLAQITRANILYANGNNNFFVQRSAANNGNLGTPAMIVSGDATKLYDNRQVFRNLGVNRLLCPFSEANMGVNMDTFKAGIHGFRFYYSYSMYYGWNGSNAANPDLKLFRLHQNFANGSGVNQVAVNTVASDIVLYRKADNIYSTFTHVGKNYDYGYAKALQVADFSNPKIKTRQDTNFAQYDGSVKTLPKVQENDARMMKLRYKTPLDDGKNGITSYLLVPNKFQN